MRTDFYERNGKRFCVGEQILKGSLITEFNERGEVAVQIHSKTIGLNEMLNLYFVGYKLKVTDVAAYTSVAINTKCASCKLVGLERELDKTHPSKITNVPVLPIFVCKNCGQRHYSLTDEYLRYMVTSNKGLFEQEEMKAVEEKPEET
ncbi:MAG: hypothetical protein KGH64_06545, partial [Candidatus Micrarchaeota archaeon]|nr:hypothetical protein [Candidatus Micrarchaeota archaeon]